MLTERQKYILTVVIDDFIRCAEPIGSRSVSKHTEIGCSPATIRNDMSDLEALGYLEQPHPSSGRVPSQKGYRYYVDYLLSPGMLTDHEKEKVKSFFAHRIDEMQQVIQHATQVLSQLTQYTAVVLGPETRHHTLASIQLIPIADETAVALLVTNTGHVENRTVRLPNGVSLQHVEQFVRLMNDKLRGVPLSRLRQKIEKELMAELMLHIADYEELNGLIDALFTRDGTERFVWGGAKNMLRHSEFQNVEKVRDLLDTLDQAQSWRKVFANVPQGIHVKIGEEFSWQAIHDCSMITASYTIDDDAMGMIGVLGPVRMDYRRVIAVLQQFTAELSHQFSRGHRQTGELYKEGHDPWNR